MCHDKELVGQTLQSPDLIGGHGAGTAEQYLQQFLLQSRFPFLKQSRASRAQLHCN